MMGMNDMELVERYLDVMAEHLPEKIRDDVIDEMRGNIMDMLPDQPTGQDIRTVLEKLGDPASLAGSYRRDKNYLIGPAVYDSYVSVLKTAVVIAAVVYAFIALMSFLLKGDGPIDFATGSIVNFLADLAGEVIIAAFEGAVFACVWVTVTFAIIERTGISTGNPLGRKKWTADDLLLPSAGDKSRISRTETTIGIFFSVFFTALLLAKPDLFGWYERVDGVIVLKEPVLNKDQLYRYAFVIAAFAAVQFALAVYKFIIRHWNIPAAVFNAVYNAALAVFVFILSRDMKLINPGFISLVAQKTGWSDAKALTNYQNFAAGFTVIFIIFCAVDSVFGFVLSRRQKPTVKSILT